MGYGFLIGQQYSASGQPLNDRAGNPLNFTRDFSLTNSNETQAIRVIKYHPFDGTGSASEKKQGFGGMQKWVYKYCLKRGNLPGYNEGSAAKFWSDVDRLTK